MRKPVLRHLGISILAFSAVLWQGKAFAQDDTIVDAAQFAGILDETGLFFPLVNVAEPPSFSPTLNIFWVDFSVLTNAIGDVRNATGSIQDGINVWPVRLIRTASGTLVTYPYTGTVLLQLSAADDDDFETRYAQVLRSWCVLTGKNPTSYDDLIAQGCDLLAPKSIVLDLWLADVNDCPVTSNLSMSMMEDSESCDSCDDLVFNAFDPNDPPCGRLTFNKFKISTNNFILEWFSDTNATYEIASTTDMTSTNWISLASLYPGASGTNLTDFIDFGALTNRTKFYKVAKTGISILMCDSNTASGVLNIPVEVGIPANQMLSGVTFILDGVGSRAMISPQPPFSSQISGAFDTALTTNGWHTIQALASYPLSDGSYDVYTSQVVTVQTQNHITFPDMLFTWDTSIGVRAKLDVQITNWTASIISPSNQVLRAYSGITSNGQIDFIWDGNNSNGVAFTGNYVTLSIDDPYTRIFRREGSHPSTGYFIVSYMPLFNPVSVDGLQFQNMMDQVAGDVGASSQYSLIIGNDTSGAWQLSDTGAYSWGQWAYQLASNGTQNLYYFGHGSQSIIGSRDTDINSGYRLVDLGALLGNDTGPGTNGYPNPFHFVFLDACNGGNGHWSDAFGIERLTTTSQYFTTNGAPARAFASWNTYKGYAFAGTIFNSAHGQFIINLFDYWSSHTPAPGFQDAVNHSAAVSGGTSGYPADMKIYGATDLLWNSP